MTTAEHVGPPRKHMITPEIPHDLYVAIKEQARIEDRSMTAVVRVALRQYLALHGGADRD